MDFLGPYAPWYWEHCRPLNAAVYREDEAESRRLLAAAWDVLRSDSAIDPDGRRTLEYVLINYEYSLVDHFFVSNEASGKQHAATWAELLALPPAGPQSDIAQAACFVILLGSGTRRGFISLDEPEVDALWARILEEAQTPNLWYYIVAWAYWHRNLKYLELALAHQTVTTTGWQDDYFWLRTNLMYLLVDGRAARLDIEKTIKGYTHPRDITDFRNLFLARCEEAGIMDAELHALLAQREAELSELLGTLPEPTPKIARVVKPG